MDGDGAVLEDDSAVKGTLLAGVLLVGVIGGFAFAGYVYRDPINAFLNQFSTFIDGNFIMVYLLLFVCVCVYFELGNEFLGVMINFIVVR